jgi:chorismate mutase/prephenate dehydratase
MENIEKLRKDIDAIDDKLVELLDKRSAVAKQIGLLKSNEKISVIQTDREKQIIERLKQKVSVLPIDAVEPIWKEIMAASKTLQGRSLNVSFLGPEGTFTQIAARNFFSKSGTQFIAATNKTDVFNRVEGDYVDFGIVPIENSLEGSVAETLDLLIEKNLKIFGEIELRIVHNLIGKKGIKLTDIKTVYSHPQALAQCNTWIIKNLPNADLVETTSTAKAIEKVAKMDNNTSVAIGTTSAAEIYELSCIVEGIEDNTQNYTRFLVISKHENSPSNHDKTSMVFVTQHLPGALYQVLKFFAEAKINLMKIESRPNKKNPWEYVFILDFEGNQKDVAKVLEVVKGYTVWMKILGSYPIFSGRNMK